jgi:phage-related protein (TIGR01555 family)
MAKRKTLTIDSAAQRRDGWENLLTGVADASRDKREGATPVTRLLTFEGARSLWRSDDTAALVIEKPADDMTRKWFDVTIQTDTEEAEVDPDALNVSHETQEAMGAEFKRLKAPRRFRDALRYQRAFGGAGILIGVNDGVPLAELAKPVNENSIRSVDYLTVFDTRELQVLDYYSNPLAPDFGEPSLYRINPRALGLAGMVGIFDVHESRILRFCGPLTSRDDLLYNHGWGDSVLGRMFEVIRDYGLSWSGAAALIQDFSQAVFKIKGLADAIAGDREQTVIKRLKLMDLSRSYLRGIALDAESEDFERKPTPLSGLPELLDRFVNRLAQAGRFPVSMITGQSPAGLNATGSENTRYYYDWIAAEQESEVTPPATKLARYLFKAKQGPTRGKEPANWSITHRRLWQLDEGQEADKRLKHAQADAVYLTNGVVTPEEVRQRFEGDRYNDDLKLDRESRDAFDATNPAEGDPSTPRLDPNDPNAAKPIVGAKPAQGGPGAPAQGAGGAASPVNQTAAAGPKAPAAKVADVLEILDSVATQKIPRESGLAVLSAFFGLAPEAAEAVMATIGKGFTRKADPAPVVAPPADGTPTNGDDPAKTKRKPAGVAP